MPPTTWALLALVIGIAGCARPGASDGEGTKPSRPLVNVPSPETLPSGETGAAVGEVPDDIMAAIVADAERQTGVAAGEIDVVRAESVTWTDGSLGCPEPGMMYTQALVDGYHVVLDVEGEPLDYRVDSAGGFRICDEPSRPGGHAATHA